MSLPTRNQANQLLERYIQGENLRKHSRMVAQALEAYAEELSEDKELWYQTGLLHDLDWEAFPDEHPNKAVAELLTDYPDALKIAIAGHAPDRSGIQPESQLARYLYACDELSGFLSAVSLMRPDGFDGMKPKSVKKKLKDRSFAAGVKREDITHGLSLIDRDLDEHIAFLISVFNSTEK